MLLDMLEEQTVRIPLRRPIETWRAERPLIYHFWQLWGLWVCAEHNDTREQAAHSAQRLAAIAINTLIAIKTQSQ